jgi:hypothetical protein
VRLLLLRPGTPVVHCMSVRDDRAPGMLPVPAAMDQKAVCAYHGNGHSDPNIIHHMGELFVPLLQKMVCKTLLCILSFSPCDAIGRVDYRGEVLPHFQAWTEILVLLFLLLLCKYFLVSVICTLKMAVRPCCQKPCALASPRSLVGGAWSVGAVGSFSSPLGALEDASNLC